MTPVPRPDENGLHRSLKDQLDELREHLRGYQETWGPAEAAAVPPADLVVRVQLQRVAEKLRDGLALLSREGRIVFANTALGRLLDAAAYALIGQRMLDLVAAGDRDRVERRLAGAETAPDEPVSLISESGELVLVELEVTWVEERMCLILRDQTGPKRLARMASELQLLRAENRALREALKCSRANDGDGEP